MCVLTNNWQIRAKLVPTILANMPSKYRRQAKSLECPSCSRPSPLDVEQLVVSDAESESFSAPISHANPLHSQSHLLSGECEAVRDLLSECEPSDDKSLAQFFMKVVARNMEIEENDLS